MRLSQSWWAKWSAFSTESVRTLALFMIAVYRSCLSGLVGGICRYQPTCSQYAHDAFTQHPPLKAFWLTFRRLLRCHPLGGFGYDPVPERKST